MSTPMSNYNDPTDTLDTSLDTRVELALMSDERREIIMQMYVCGLLTSNEARYLLVVEYVV